jgi:hypothetical protein
MCSARYTAGSKHRERIAVEEVAPGAQRSRRWFPLSSVLSLLILTACDAAPEIAKAPRDADLVAARVEDVEQEIRRLVTYEGGLLSIYDPIIKTISVLPNTISTGLSVCSHS